MCTQRLDYRQGLEVPWPSACPCLGSAHCHGVQGYVWDIYIYICVYIYIYIYIQGTYGGCIGIMEKKTEAII